MRYAFAMGIAAVSALSILQTSRAENWPQWLGPDRNGVSHEIGLLADWPQEGPKLLWRVDNIGRGYSTPAIVGDRIYLMASEGLENEFVEALEVKDGNKIWSTRTGTVGSPKQSPNYPTARSTPTIDGDMLYALSSDGDLVCLDRKTGGEKWKKNVRHDFGGVPGEWAYAESPLVDGNALICAPGGSQATVVALQKNTGDVIWKCALPEADEAAFSSTIVDNAGGIHEYVHLLSKGLVGIDAATGHFLWRYSKPISQYGANIQTPLASGDFIFCSATGTGGGAVKLKIDGPKVAAEQVYFGSSLPVAIGGVVKVGDYLYGTTTKVLVCADFTTGQIKWKDDAIGTASICYADGRLYLHGENGKVALVEASPEAYREHGRFSPADQPAKKDFMEKSWCYPVVADGKLYIRDNNVLWCYSVASGK